MSKEDIEWKEAKKPKKVEYTKEELKIIEIIKTVYDPEIPVIFLILD